MYEHRTQNYDLEIHEEYVMHDTPFLCHIIYDHFYSTKECQTILSLDRRERRQIKREIYT